MQPKPSLPSTEDLDVELPAPSMRLVTPYEPRPCGQHGCRRNDVCADCRRPVLSLFGAFAPPPPPRESGILPRCRGVAPELRGARPRRHDFSDAEFGALRVLGFAGLAKGCRNARWSAECRLSHGGCGNVVVLRGDDLPGRTCCRHCAVRQRVTLRGQTLPLLGWERELRSRGLQVGWQTIKTRLRLGWTPEEALSTPVARGEGTAA